jgi:hypothetical protein
MITTTPEGKEQPFQFVRPQLPARPFGEGSGAELEANKESLWPAAQAFTAIEEILQRATAEGERLGKDPNLTATGRRAAFTELALKELAILRGHLAKLDAAGVAIEAEAKQVQVQKAGPTPSDGQRAERSAIASAFGKASPAAKKSALERAMLGKDPALADALAYSHPMLSGLTENTIELLRTELEGPRIDPAIVERIQDKALKVGTVKRTLTAAIDALENASDRASLKEAGVATLRRSDLTDKQKADFIDAHGLPAFKALPA